MTTPNAERVAPTVLLRGRHILPHQCQAIRRDRDAERIRKHLGGSAHGYRLTADQLQERRDGKGGLPYEFLIYTPESAATSWTASFTSWDLRDWLEAYGLSIEGEYPGPGEPFTVRFPNSADAFKPLCEAVPLIDGFDAGENDPCIICGHPRPEHYAWSTECARIDGEVSE